MQINKSILANIIAEELTASDKSEIKNMISKELKKMICEKYAITKPVCVYPSAVDVEDFEISKSMMGMQIKVEGNVPLIFGSKARSGGKHPWAIYIKKTDNLTLKKRYPYRLSLETTDHFPSFKNEFTKLNIILSPDPHQPLLMKIRNSDQSALRVFTGSVEIQGKHHALYEGGVRKRISMQMKGGVYDHAAPVIFFNIE